MQQTESEGEAAAAAETTVHAHRFRVCFGSGPCVTGIFSKDKLKEKADPYKNKRVSVVL